MSSPYKYLQKGNETNRFMIQRLVDRGTLICYKGFLANMMVYQNLDMYLI